MNYSKIQFLCNTYAYSVAFCGDVDYIFIPYKRWYVAIEVGEYHWGLKLRLRSKRLNKVTRVLEPEEAENLFYEHKDRVSALAYLLVGHEVVGLIDEEVER